MSTLAVSNATSSVVKSSQVEDLEKTPVDKVLAILAVQSDRGLSSTEAPERLAKYGPNGRHQFCTAHRNHDRHHVAARRRADHDHCV
jgi:hypothetical protein